MGFTYELICFSVKGDVVFFRNAKREDTYINNAWEMANAFNENHKLHSWVIHYDEVNFLELNKVEICLRIKPMQTSLNLLYFRYRNLAGNA